MAEQFAVRVNKTSHVFSAGHFITFDGAHVERLHGHNYRASAEVTGPLDGNGYLFDFLALRDRFREIVDRLDHRMLLPGESPLLIVEQYDGSTWVKFESKRWMFPTDDCIILPVTNTTSELLARYLGRELLATLQERHGFTPGGLVIELEESPGFTARVEWSGQSTDRAGTVPGAVGSMLSGPAVG